MLLKTATIVLIIVGASECLSHNRKSQKGNNPHDLELIGTVEGRSYYAEANLKMTWKEALKHCQDAGYRLASIETPAQIAFLASNLYKKYKDSFWTAARDDRDITGLVWHNTNKKPDRNGFQWGSDLGGTDYQQCGYTYAKNEAELGLRGYFCIHAFKPLCEY